MCQIRRTKNLSKDGVERLIKVLRPTRHKIGHFRDVLPMQPISWLSTEKLKQTKQSKHASIT